MRFRKHREDGKEQGYRNIVGIRRIGFRERMAGIGVSVRIAMSRWVFPWGISFGKSRKVERSGFEPLTPCMPCKCSTN